MTGWLWRLISGRTLAAELERNRVAAEAVRAMVAPRRRPLA